MNTQSLPRAVVCVDNPEKYLSELKDYSIMVINPNSHPARLKYLLDNSDYSLLITNNKEEYRHGKTYNEKLFWYTSGTTGDSKFCSFTQEQLDISINRICQIYDIDSNDRYTSIMPLWHAHGQAFYWAVQKAGCKTNFLSIKEIKNITKNSPTFITAIPDVLKVVARLNLENLRFIRSASAAMPPVLYTHLKEKFNTPIIEAFGMTETMSQCFTNPLYGEQRIGTVGLPDGVEARITNGELYVKGPTVVTPGWFNTGDLAEQDEAGYYRILGRSRDQINVRGIKVNPLSLEQQLINTIPGVDECVIFGQDRVKCLYIGDALPKDIITFLSNLGQHCRPTLVKSVDSFPVAASGKVSRTYLNKLTF
jgi:oxalate---CoA ligase